MPGLAPPGREMGGVQPLPTQQRANGPLLLNGLSLLDNRAFVIGGEPAPLGLGRHLGIGDRIPAREDSSRCAPAGLEAPPLRSGSLRSPSLRSGASNPGASEPIRRTLLLLIKD